MSLKHFFVLFYFLSVNFAFAETTNTTQEAEKDSEFNWQFMVSMAAVYDPVILKGVEVNGVDDFLALSFSLDIYYKGFYIQSNQRRADGQFMDSEIGYQLVEKDDWAVDILLKTYLYGYSPKYITESQNQAIPTLDGLDDRDSDNGLALRYSKFIDDDLFYIDVATLGTFSKVDGWLIDTFYSHLIQHRNWDIYIGAGATFYSDGVVNYYLGVTPSEENEYRPEHKGDSAFLLQAEINAQHPISENWSFKAGISQKYYSKEIIKSPLADKQYITQVLIGVMYVF